MILAPVSRVTSLRAEVEAVLLAVGDFEGHVGRELAGEAALLGLGEEHHLHALAFLHQVGVLHDVMGKGNLLVGLFVHEVEGLAVIVQILVGTAFDADGVQFDTGGEGVFEDTAVFEVAELGLDKGGTFAGFHVLEIHHDAGFAVEHDVHSVLEVSCCCHIKMN